MLDAPLLVRLQRLRGILDAAGPVAGHAAGALSVEPLERQLLAKRCNEGNPVREEQLEDSDVAVPILKVDIKLGAQLLRSVPILVSPDPMAAIEARDLLVRVMASSPKVAHVVELAARGLIGADAARAVGQPRATYHAHERKLRAALRKLGAAPAPKQAPRPTWKQRKRRR